jgi:hypothetical protein
LLSSFGRLGKTPFARFGPADEKSGGLLSSAHIHDVNVSAQSDVVCQVPANMVRVVIDHDVVATPIPVATKSYVKGGDAEVRTVEPKPARASTLQPPTVACADAKGKPPVFPGMIEVVVGVAAPGVMSNPRAVGVNVRSVGMPFLVAIATGLLLRPRFLNVGRLRGVRLAVRRGRATGGDIAAAIPLWLAVFRMLIIVLGKSGGDRNHQ